MSNTDKDRPHWVKSVWWEPYHYRCPHATWNKGQRRCDLPADPVVHRPPRYGVTGQRACEWIPADKGRWWSKPPNWYCRHVWTAPQRQKARTQCLRALREYNAHGDTDGVVTVDQHHHGAWWYWN